MNCRETQQMIYRYLNNDLDEKELQAFLGHVRECPSCYEELEIYYSIHFALDYLEDEEKGMTNPAQSLRKELTEKSRSLRKHRMFRSFQVVLVGLAFLALILTTAIQVCSFMAVGPFALQESQMTEEDQEEDRDNTQSQENNNSQTAGKWRTGNGR